MKKISRRDFLKVAGVSAAALSLSACGAASSAAPAASGSTASSAAASTAGGKVYYLNFKPESDQAWQWKSKATPLCSNRIGAKRF
ncbi:MAG: twin-arginine translocation signal domain-containing protein [Faecalibacterium sp.]|jgi:hypothetical protein|nr:twin-arginine translocation signal domain-containing protein [Faecalibacterium sp.]